MNKDKLKQVAKELKGASKKHSGQADKIMSAIKQKKHPFYPLDDPQIADRIKKRFGTYAKFKKEFIDNAASQFGSGWGWLVEKNGRLDLAKTPNQDNPLMYGMGKPVLGVDVWEHSYYLMYGPDRKEWLSKFFDIVNWDFCSALLHTS